MLLLKIYYLQMILGNLLLQIVVHLKEFPIVQWGTYPGSGGTIRYPVSFTSKVFAVISSSSLNFNATDINNLAYWTTTDTNIGNNWKTSGWYLAMGK